MTSSLRGLSANSSRIFRNFHPQRSFSCFANFASSSDSELSSHNYSVSGANNSRNYAGLPPRKEVGSHAKEDSFSTQGGRSRSRCSPSRQLIFFHRLKERRHQTSWSTEPFWFLQVRKKCRNSWPVCTFRSGCLWGCTACLLAGFCSCRRPQTGRWSSQCAPFVV